MKKSFTKVLCFLLCLVLTFGIMPKINITSHAADKGSESVSSSSQDGTVKVSMSLNNASYVSGNTAVYVVDRYFYTDMTSFGNTYSVKFEVNGMMVSTEITSSGYSISDSAKRSDQILNTSDNVYTYDTTSGYFIGDVPAAGSSTEFTLTASISDTYQMNGYPIFHNSTSTSLGVKIIGVDTTNLRQLITSCAALRSSCWTSATWSSFSTALSNAQSIINNTSAQQSEINSAYNALNTAKQNLVHNGPISGCQYCLGNSSGNTTINVDSYLNLSYGNNGSRSLYDLYLPANTAGDISMILFIHGGAWMFGSKEDMTNEAYNACKNYGLATAAISYRYTSIDVNGFDILDDVQAAVSAIKTEAASKGLNIKKMMVYGFSAGAHLSLMYAYTRADVSAIKPVCVFSKSGPAYLYNDKYMEESSDMPFILSCICGQYFTVETRQLAFNALLNMSPMHYVNSSSVPTVVCHGMNDGMVPFTDSVILNQALDNAGVEHVYITFPNSNHGLESDPDKSVLMQAAYEDYVNRFLLDITPTVTHHYQAAIKHSTCTTEGYTSYTCTDCGKYYVSDFVPASHTNAAEVKENVAAATCANEGGYDGVVYCTVCGEEVSRTHVTVSKLAHTSGEWEEVIPATYTTEGQRIIKCTVCGEVLESQTIAVLPVPEISGKVTTTITVDKDNHLIKGVPQGVTGIEEFINHDGCTFEYEKTSNILGTGTIVKVKSLLGVLIDTYTIVIDGDVTGDGYVDAFDLAVAGEYINTFTQPTQSAYMSALDVVHDGYLDATDLAFMIYYANFEQ